MIPERFPQGRGGGAEAPACSRAVRPSAVTPILLNAASDPAGDAKRETGGFTSGNFPNLDILQSSMSQPDPSNCHPAGTPCYRVRMTINNLSLTPPFAANPVAVPPYPGDPVAVWLTQWLVPADPNCSSSSSAASCTNGGKNPFVYFESDGLTPPTCWSGENAVQRIAGGVTLTYPGTKQITAPGACSFVLGPFGTITIDVPIADVSLDPGVAPLSNRLYSVTASTMTPTMPPDSVPLLQQTTVSVAGVSRTVSRLGGALFDLIDVVRPYDFVPGAGGGGTVCHAADGDGDEPGKNGGTAHFHFHEDDCNQQPERAKTSAIRVPEPISIPPRSLRLAMTAWRIPSRSRDWAPIMACRSHSRSSPWIARWCRQGCSASPSATATATPAISSPGALRSASADFGQRLRADA